MVSAAGMEDFGGQPLSEGNCADWPGVMPLLNSHTLVYHSWWNGNEEFDY
jgi:hypothetical protein